MMRIRSRAAVGAKSEPARLATVPVGDAALLGGLVVAAVLLSGLAALTILRRLSPSEVLREQ